MTEPRSPPAVGLSTTCPRSWPAATSSQPTVIVGVDNRSAIAQQEIFGPVLVIIPFDDDDEAVRLANDSVYGLAGAVLSRRRSAE